jgi:hypothetical protein
MTSKGWHRRQHAQISGTLNNLLTKGLLLLQPVR